ncbi:MAG: GntR family transcriptional regulator [Bryobacteraceae bacterium]
MSTKSKLDGLPDRGAGGVETPTLDTPVRSATLRSQVVDILRDAIFYGKLQPDELLPEQQLAKKLQVSQSTVREALAQLEHYGLVVRQPNRGTTVTSFSPIDIRHRVKVRIVLEQLAWAEACLYVTDADIAHLEEEACGIESLLAEGSYFHAAQTDLRFHRYVWQRSGNPVLFQTLDVLTVPLFAFMSVMLNMAGSSLLQKFALPHPELVEALRTRDPEQVREAIRRHLPESPLAPEVAASPVAAQTEAILTWGGGKKRRL